LTGWRTGLRSTALEIRFRMRCRRIREGRLALIATQKPRRVALARPGPSATKWMSPQDDNSQKTPGKARDCGRVKGILRLRFCFASRSKILAQDDKDL
jgi:hypothetical protein